MFLYFIWLVLGFCPGTMYLLGCELNIVCGCGGVRILVADISIPDSVRPPVAEFLGVEAGKPAPARLVWRGHEVIVRPGISVGEAVALKPDFVMALMGWHGVGGERSRFYEYFFDRGVPVFTWGNDSNIPRLMAQVVTGNPLSRRIVFAKPNHPILAGVRPEDVRTSGNDYRTLVKAVRGDIGLAFDPDNGSWEIIYLEERNHRWLHYHPYPSPPPKLVENMLSYMTRPTIPMPILVGAGVGAVIAAVATYASTRKPENALGGAAVGALVGGAIGFLRRD
jgi:hypothetical protein